MPAEVIVFGYAMKLCYLALGGEVLAFAVKEMNKAKNKLATGEIAVTLKEIEGKNGLKLSVNHQLSFTKTKEGVIVIGPTGEHKTVSVFDPNLLSNDLPVSSIIVADPKGELWERTHLYQESIGRRAILFAPLELLSFLAKYNPLANCRDFTEVRELAQLMLQNADLIAKMQSGGCKGGDSFWVLAGIPLLTAAFLYAKDKGYPYDNMCYAFKKIIDCDEDMLKVLFMSSKNEDVKTQYKMFAKSGKSPSTLSSIQTSLMTYLSLLTDKNLESNISNNTFTPEGIRKSPTVLYIKYDEAKSDYLAPFMSVFYTQLMNRIMYTKGIPVIYLLDEFQNIGRIGNITQVAAVCRDRDMALVPCCQSISKLYSIYGKDETLSILNNLKTKCVMPSLSDLDTLNYIRDLCGDKEINNTNSNNVTTKVTKKVMGVDEIRRLNSDEMLIIAHNLNPVIDKQNRYYEHAEYTKNVSSRR